MSKTTTPEYLTDADFSHISLAQFKDLYEDIESVYKSKNKLGKERITPYSMATVQRIKTLHFLLAHFYFNDYVYYSSYSTGLAPEDYSNPGSFPPPRDQITNQLNKHFIDFNKFESKKSLHLASHLIEKYLELEPDEFRKEIGLDSPNIKDEKKIYKQTLWLFDFIIFLLRYIYPDSSNGDKIDTEYLYLSISDYNWSDIAERAYVEYFNLKRIWSVIKSKILDFNDLRQPAKKKHADTPSDNDDHKPLDFGKFKHMSDLSPQRSYEDPEHPHPIYTNYTSVLLLTIITDSNKRLEVVNTAKNPADKMIELLSGIPIDKFAICARENCGKLIIRTDKKKECCSKKARSCSTLWAKAKREQKATKQIQDKAKTTNVS